MVAPLFQMRCIGDHSLLVFVAKYGDKMIYLNQTASRIYQETSEGAAPAEIIAGFTRDYPSVSHAILERDITGFLQRLDQCVQGTPTLEGAISDGHFSETVLRRDAQQAWVPIEGSLELTFRCNLRCQHCYCIWCQWQRSERSTTEILDTLDQIRESGCLWLLLTGGEPLLRPDFNQIYSYARQKGFLVSVFTNGLLLNESICEVLATYPPMLLELSVYGMSNGTYNKITGHKSGFSRFQHVCDLLERYDINYALKSMVQRDNWSELPQMRQFAYDHGKKFRFDADVHARLDGQDVGPDVRLSPIDIVNIELDGNPHEIVRVWSESAKDRHRAYDQRLFCCQAGRTSFNIDPFGYVSMCGRVRNPEFSLTENTFAAIWQALNQMNARPVPNDFSCRSCPSIEFCRTCPAAYWLPASLREVEFCATARQRATAFTNVMINKGEDCHVKI
ncbi:MAG: PqqD family peptide modification chaperone [Acidobacteriia bacterium]|nr:PqqD family peptide modification chaperone [Terriglobia bacterium]